MLIEDNPARQMGLPLDEGIIVAYIPKTDQMGTEYEYRDGDRWFVAMAYDDKLLDLLPADKKNVKWWVVREAARQLGLNEVTPLYAGPVEDLHISCLPQLPRPEHTNLAMRQYSRGPWIILEEKDESRRSGQLEFDFAKSGDQSICIS